MSVPSSSPPRPDPAGGMGRVRTPKTAELVARRLRQMIVDGELSDGDFLPHEATLTTQFQVSRPTLREAIRILESERLVEVRRGSRTGARVCVPGPEIVARPAGLLLELAGATLTDVMVARAAIEPAGARLLAEEGSDEALEEFARIVDGIPQAWEQGDIARASAHLHRRLVELSGNATLGVIAGMLHEISEKHTAAAIARDHPEVPKALYNRLLRSYRRFVELLQARDGAEAEAHWRRHMETASGLLLEGYEDTKVRDFIE